jgi:hypothetical protein
MSSSPNVFTVGGRVIVRPGPSSTLTARVCAICQKPQGTIAHTVQDDSGEMRSIFAHLPCIRKLLNKGKR